MVRTSSCRVNREGMNDDLPGALCAPNSRREQCYGNSLWFSLPRLHLVRPHWRRPPLQPGAVMVGVAAGTMALAAHACLSAGLPTSPAATVAVTYDDWCRPHGVRG